MARCYVPLRPLTYRDRRLSAIPNGAAHSHPMVPQPLPIHQHDHRSR